MLPGVEPTCTDEGLTEGSYCSVCGIVLVAQEVIPATGHSYDNGICTNCGEADPDWIGEFPFKDVPEEQWYRAAVEYVYHNELMNGMSEDTFEPESTLTRAMLVTILYRMAGSPEVEATNIFTDVADGLWYSDAIAWGYANGIVMGMSETEFMPDLALTREQMVTFLYRYAQYVGHDVSAGENTDLELYNDAQAISSYALEAICWAIGEGIINGMGDGQLQPQGTAIRAQVAQVIMKFDALLS